VRERERERERERGEERVYLFLCKHLGMCSYMFLERLILHSAEY
jgi:hypothetical protein